jgi:imidazole glycerol-phosphate synthase subunit HisF
MFRPRIIPVLLLKNKGLVKTVRFKNPRYIGDPINAVKIFNDLKTDELVFLDITASMENRCISVQLVKDIGDEAYMPFAVGGGISRVDQIGELISAGAEKVVLNTAAGLNPLLVKEAAAVFGNQSIIVSIDLKKDIFHRQFIYLMGGTKKNECNLDDYVRRIEDAGAGELLINSIDRDGTMLGYDLDMIKGITTLTSLPVIACGGAGSLNDLHHAVISGGASAAAAGSLFVYHGARNAVLINYPEKEVLTNLFHEKN